MNENQWFYLFVLFIYLNAFKYEISNNREIQKKL